MAMHSSFSLCAENQGRKRIRDVDNLRWLWLKRPARFVFAAERGSHYANNNHLSLKPY